MQKLSGMGAFFLVFLGFTSLLTTTTDAVRLPTALTGWASNTIQDLSHRLSELAGDSPIANEPIVRRGLAEITKWPTPTGEEEVPATIIIKEGETFNGGGKRYHGVGGRMGGGQGEGQKQLFQVMPGGTLENVIIGVPGGDGVHCRGSCTLRNVYWEDVGEDAATLKGTDPSQVMLIEGGGARDASDKVFQHNGPGTMIIRDFYCENFGKLYRSCGNCPGGTFQRHVEIDNVVVKPPFRTVVGVNVNSGGGGDTAVVKGLTVLTAPGSAPPKVDICEKYTAAHGGEPTLLGSGMNDENCKFTTADVGYSSEPRGLPGLPSSNPTPTTVPEIPSKNTPVKEPVTPPPKTTSGGKVVPKPKPKPKPKPSTKKPSGKKVVPSPKKRKAMPAPSRRSREPRKPSRGSRKDDGKDKKGSRSGSRRSSSDSNKQKRWREKEQLRKARWARKQRKAASKKH